MSAHILPLVSLLRRHPPITSASSPSFRSRRGPNGSEAHGLSSPSSTRRGGPQQMPTTSGPLPPHQPLFSHMPQMSYNPHHDHLLLAPQPPPTSPPTRKRKQPGMASMPGLQSMPPSGLGDPGGLGESMEPLGEPMPPVSAPKKSRTNTPWTPAEEQRLKMMRDAQNSWGEIAKVRTLTQKRRYILIGRRRSPTEPKEV